jgi:hypothetical protein
MARHHLVAVFTDSEQACHAYDILRKDRFSERDLSVVGRQQAGEQSKDDPERPARLAGQLAEGAAKGGLLGGAAGGILGFIGGAIAFGIPGIGPAVGAGVWASLAAGSAAGATAGGMALAFGKMWELRYRDLVRDGRVVLAVHTDHEDDIKRAVTELKALNPEHLDEFDAGGELLFEYAD